MAWLQQILGLAICAVASASATAEVIYVNGAATGTNTGETWDDAHADLHDALAGAQPGDEIWVARGRYTPDRGTKDRTMSFVLVPGVGLYGGFGGWEAAREQRDWIGNPTILSGDLNGDDKPQACVENSDCCIEHDGVGCDDQACEAVVCARAPDCCGGSNPKFPYWWQWGCAWLARRECCDLDDRNLCENAHKVLVADVDLKGAVVDGFTISGAYATEAESMPPGGTAGAWLRGSAPTFENCTFENNVHGLIVRGDFTIRKCDFLHNIFTAVSPVGGNYSVGEVDDCRFADSRSSIGGGHSLYVTRSIFERNRFNLGGADIVHVEDSDFIDNFYAAYDGYDSGAFLRCRFFDNVAGVLVGAWGPTKIQDCLFVRNRGTGPIVASGFYAEIVNCLFVGNTVMNQMGGLLRMSNCTFADNVAGPSTDATLLIQSISPRALIENSIFWNNASPHEPDIEIVYDASVTISHSILDGVAGPWTGSNNMTTDPIFVDPLGPDNVAGTGDEDYRLSPDSPAINAGAITAYTPDHDLDGHARVLCGAIDLGPYEFGIGDYDCDRQITPADFPAWTFCLTGPALTSGPLPGGEGGGCEALDFNGDARIDLSDFFDFQGAFAP